MSKFLGAPNFLKWHWEYRLILGEIAIDQVRWMKDVNEELVIEMAEG